MHWWNMLATVYTRFVSKLSHLVVGATALISCHKVSYHTRSRLTSFLVYPKTKYSSTVIESNESTNQSLQRIIGKLLVVHGQTRLFDNGPEN